MRTLHFNLSHLKDQKGLMVHANFEDYPLESHTNLTRQQIAKKSLLFEHLPETSLTHFITNLPVSATRPSLIEISVPKVINGQTVRRTVAMKIHVPSGGRKLALQMIKKSGAQHLIHPKLLKHTKTSPNLLKSNLDLASPAGLDEYVTPFDTAVSLLFHHPSIINLSEAQQGKIPAYIIEKALTDAIYADYGLPTEIEDLGEDWATEKPVMEPLPDGKTQHMRDPDNPNLFLYTREINPRVLKEIEGTLKIALISIQQDLTLKGQQWNVQYGIGADQKKSQEVKAGRAVKFGTTKWTLANKTPGKGLTFSPNIKVEPGISGKGNYHGSGVWTNDPKIEKRKVLDATMISLLMKEKIILRISSPKSGAVSYKPLKFVKQGEEGAYVANFKEEKPQGLGVSAFFYINAYKTGVTYEIASYNLDSNGSADLIVLEGGTEEVVKQLELINTDGDSWGDIISITTTNEWVRHLGAYVQFLDGAGKEIEVDKKWPEQLPHFLRAAFQNNPTKKYLGILGPVNLVFGIPVSNESATFRFPVHKKAQTVRLLMGGLGTGEFDDSVCIPGLTLTVALELALPMFMLTAGAAIMNSKWVTDLMKDKAVLYSVIALGLTLTGGDIHRQGDAEKPLLRLANVAGPMLLKTGIKTVIEKQVAAAAATKLIPIVGQAFQVLSAAVTLAQLGQTIAAVVQAPFVYKCDIVGTIDLDIDLTPDPQFHYFPQGATAYKVRIAYDKSATTREFNGTLTSGITLSDPIKVRFNDVPSGGNIKVFAFFYAKNGWQAGQAESQWYNAQANQGNTLRINSVEVTNNIPVLTGKSVYGHFAKTAIEGNKHIWKSGSTPTAVFETHQQDTNHQIRDWTSITLAQRPASLGYTWQATGLNIPRDTDPKGAPTNDVLYVAQNLSILQHPEDGYATSKVGFSYPAGIAYDIATKDDGHGYNFFITSGISDDNYHLRGLKLGYDIYTKRTIPPVFEHSSKKSWGRFSAVQDRLVVHPQGYVFGINTNESKIYSLQLPAQATTESEAPFASLASGPGKRDGLIDHPVAIAIGFDGVILILEKFNKRVQAFDINCNPVGSYFTNGAPAVKSCFLNLPDEKNVEYLDLAVEGKGYLYVLSRINGGKKVDDYFMTIYTPSGEKLVTTQGVPAAKLALGLDRTMYTLNFEVLFGKENRPEPSISSWLPPPPDATF